MAQNQILTGQITSVTQMSLVRATTAASTTSGSFVDIDGTNAIVTMTTTGGNVLFLCTLGCNQTVNAQDAEFALALDGITRSTLARWRSPSASGDFRMVTIMDLCTGLSAASHTFKPRWLATQGGGTNTLSLDGTTGCQILVVEFEK